VKRSTNTSATGSGASLQGGFTLVELLSVVAIMAIVMGILGLSLRNMQGPSTQIAAAQVASGLSLARQLAISRNADTRFIIYGGGTGTVSTNQGLPSESWRYWTVIMTNKDPTAPNNTWIMQKEWEKLPEGVVFLNIATGAYSTIAGDPIGATLGRAFRPLLNTSIGGNKEWTGFTSFGTFNVSTPAAPNVAAFTLTSAPVIGYKPTGEAVECKGTPRGTSFSSGSQAAALRVAEGSSTDNGEIVLRSLQNYYYVETDKLGRVRVRARESYRE